jgi:hypothetical protein
LVCAYSESNYLTYQDRASNPSSRSDRVCKKKIVSLRFWALYMQKSKKEKKEGFLQPNLSDFIRRKTGTISNDPNLVNGGR